MPINDINVRIELFIHNLCEFYMRQCIKNLQHEYVGFIICIFAMFAQNLNGILSQIHIIF